MRVLRLYTRELGTSVRNNSPVYGYSVLITATFAALTNLQGAPSLPQLFLFVVGAAAAFALVEAAASQFFQKPVRQERSEVLMLGSALSVMSITAGLGAGSLVGFLVKAWPAWLAGSFAATVVYLLIVGAELTVAKRAEDAHLDGDGG